MTGLLGFGCVDGNYQAVEILIKCDTVEMNYNKKHSDNVYLHPISLLLVWFVCRRPNANFNISESGPVRSLLISSLGLTDPPRTSFQGLRPLQEH